MIQEMCRYQGLSQTFNADVGAFAPDVLGAVDQIAAVLNQSLEALEAAFV